MKGGGYPLGQKGYKVYDMTTNEIYVSRDVLFFEEEFPFKKGEAIRSAQNQFDESALWEEAQEANAHAPQVVNKEDIIDSTEETEK